MAFSTGLGQSLHLRDGKYETCNKKELKKVLRKIHGIF